MLEGTDTSRQQPTYGVATRLVSVNVGIVPIMGKVPARCRSRDSRRPRRPRRPRRRDPRRRHRRPHLSVSDRSRGRARAHTANAASRRRRSDRLPQRVSSGLPVDDFGVPAVVRDRGGVWPIASGPSQTVSIIGFPFGKTGSGTAGGAPGVWVQGAVATEPALEFDGSPCRLLRAATPSGACFSP